MVALKVCATTVWLANDVSADPFLTLPMMTFMDVRSPPDEAADMP